MFFTPSEDTCIWQLPKVNAFKGMAQKRDSMLNDNRTFNTENEEFFKISQRKERKRKLAPSYFFDYNQVTITMVTNG